MKKIVYVYILDTMADWELGYVMSAINMKLKSNGNKAKYCLKTVRSNSYSRGINNYTRLFSG